MAATPGSVPPSRSMGPKSEPPASVESGATPSPMPTPHSNTTPLNDTGMPTLSPQPNPPSPHPSKTLLADLLTAKPSQGFLSRGVRKLSLPPVKQEPPGEDLPPTPDVYQNDTWLEREAVKGVALKTQSGDSNASNNNWSSYIAPHRTRVRRENSYSSSESQFVGGLSNGLKQSPSRGVKRPLSDPYCFDDDNPPTHHDNTAQCNGLLEGGGKIKEEVKDNLFTNESLQPSFSDLDKIFATDSPLTEEHHYHTPPGSNHSIGVGEDSKIGIKTTAPSSGGSGGGSVPLGELSQMYPTPPSLEHNNFDHDTTLDDVPQSNNNLFPPISNGPCIKLEPPDDPPLGCGMLSAPDLTSHASYSVFGDNSVGVFCPSAPTKFVRSNKYQALTDLPGVKNPVVCLSNSLYKPVWARNNNNSNNNSSSSSNCGGRNNMNQISDKQVSGLGSSNNNNNKIGSMSPAQPPSVGGPSSVGPPPGYDLNSPASNNSYLSKNIASVEAPPSNCAFSQIEANSLQVMF